MFPRRNRILRKEFPSILTSGKKASSPHFTLIASGGVTGYAVVVSKKVAKLAVTRHRIKRRVLSALRTLQASESNLPKTLIIFPKNSVSAMPFKQVTKELVEVLSKIRK